MDKSTNAVRVGDRRLLEARLTAFNALAREGNPYPLNKEEIEMKMKMFIVLGGIFLVGCATTGNYKNILDTWMGRDVNSLIQAWGVPHRTFTMPNGYTAYVYDKRRSVYIPGYYNPGTTSITFIGNTGFVNTYGGYSRPPRNLQMNCVTQFTIGTDNTVRSWRFEGNDCTAYPPKK